jgi:ABC-type dipeptide/oligopeptide/nickel transport system permease subunit
MTIAHALNASRRVPRIARSWPGRVGLVLGVVVLLLAFIGPYFAPYPPAQIVGVPFQGPSSAFPLGIDFNGRDVLSRVLWGGRSLIAMASLATVVSYALGISLGLLAGYTRSAADSLIMRGVDIMLSVPPLLLLLVLATGAGSGSAVLIAGVVAINVPGIVRIVRTATLDVSVRGYVEAAAARGETVAAVLRREILPNISGPVFADVGVRFTSCILLIASISFLGLGLQPPRADWALMISENRAGLTFQPWSALVPALLIAVLTIAVNLVADAVQRSRGVSIDSGDR